MNEAPELAHPEGKTKTVASNDRKANAARRRSTRTMTGHCQEVEPAAGHWHVVEVVWTLT